MVLCHQSILASFQLAEMKFGVWYGEVNCPAKEMKRIFEDWKLAESKWKVSVALALIQDLRQIWSERNSPLQGKGDGFSGQWCLVADFTLLPVLCSATVPPCYSKPSVKSDTQCTLWLWYLGAIKTSGRGSMWRHVIWKGIVIPGTSEVAEVSRNRKSESNYSPIRINFKKIRMTVASVNVTPENAQIGWDE